MAVLSSIVLASSLYHLYLVYVSEPLQQRPLIEASDFNNNNGHGLANLDCTKSIVLSDKLEAAPIASEPKRAVWQQFILAFSAVHNTEKLFRVDNRYGVLDTVRLILTFFVYALQAFHFTAEFTAQMLRSIADTVPMEMATSNAYWFARTPGLWIDGFMFTL